jgi:rod shape-determining protein MreD
VKKARYAWFALPFCLLLAALLAIMPLPDWLNWLRPQFPLLVLLYWGMALPQRYGLFSGWFAGLFLDVLMGTPLGAHALLMAIVMFLAQRLGPRMKVLATPQQMLWVAGVALAGTVFQHGLADYLALPRSPWWLAWMPVATTALVWPVAVGLQDGLRRRLQVS